MRIDNRHIKEICKIGQVKECCRYLVCSSEGFECVKHSELKALLDNRVKNNSIVAQGDNCNGYGVKEARP